MENTIDESTYSTHDHIQRLISSLPVVLEKNIPDNDHCPICLVSFRSILNDERCTPMAPGEPPSGGVTKLAECGHMFCRKDLVEWVTSFHGSCPSCRHTFLDIRPPSESENESSDGGEYIPEEEEDEEDGFFDTDGFTDEGTEDFEVGELDMEEELWSREDEFDDQKQYFEDAEYHSEEDTGFDAGSSDPPSDWE